MTDIPEDVMKTALQLFSTEFSDNGDRPVCGSPDRFIEIIARAILAERERCAKVAEALGWDGEISAGVKKSWPEYHQGEKDTADEIASSIRAGT